MTGALKYEWLRIRTIRSTYWISALAIGLTVVIAFFMILGINASFPEDMTTAEATTWVITGGASAPIIPVLAAVFFAVMGAMAMGHEYRYGTNKATLTAIPDRLAVLAAKLLILVMWVAAAVLTILVINLVMASLFLNIFEFSGVAARPILNYLGYCAGFAFAGFSLSAIFRNQTGAIVAALVWPLVIEPVINGILTVFSNAGDPSGSSREQLAKLGNLLPASAGRRMMFSPYDVFAGFGEVDTWGVGPSMLIFWVGVCALIAAGSALFVTRDA